MPLSLKPPDIILATRYPNSFVPAYNTFVVLFYSLVIIQLIELYHTSATLPLLLVDVHVYFAIPIKAILIYEVIVTYCHVAFHTNMKYCSPCLL